MTKTRLRVIVPLLQVLLLILAFSLDPLLSRRYVMRPDLEFAYVVTPLRIVVMKLNFPLAILGLPVVYLTRLAFLHVSSPTGALRSVIQGVYDLAILTSTAAFWCFVVVEFEMRKHNASCIRLSARNAERLKAIVMILIGASAAVYALWDGHRLFALDQVNRHHLFWRAVVADALIGGLFLVGWAAALIAIGVQDIATVSGSRTRLDSGEV